MGMTYTDAKRCGLEHLWPTESKPLPDVPSPPSKAPNDGMNKTERAFWERLQAARPQHFAEVFEHSLKLRVIGDRWYWPDFHAVDAYDARHISVFEVKGFMREDAELKLIAAAERYPCFRWVLVKRVRRCWECQSVTRAGINREAWTPDWLR